MYHSIGIGAIVCLAVLWALCFILNSRNSDK